MTEPLSTLWMVALASGGYVLAVVQFFKDFLNVKKLELEIAHLRAEAQERRSVLHKATPQDIDRYGKPALLGNRPGTTIIAISAVAMLSTGVSLYLLRDLQSQTRLVATLRSNIESTSEQVVRLQQENSHLKAALSARPGVQPHQGEPSVQGRIRNGEPFLVRLDGPGCAKGADRKEDLVSEVLGTLLCGKTYSVVYDRQGSSWTVTGPHKTRGSIWTDVYHNANPARNEISLWGHVVTFNENGDVFDARLGKIGQLIMPS